MNSSLPTQLHELTIAQAGRLIAQRRLSPVELARGLLRHIERFDKNIRAITTLTAELCLDQAKKAEAEIGAGKTRGPLHGIPFLLKDIIDTRGILTSACSRICADNYPEHNAAVVDRLYGAGAVLLGKATTHEFAHGGPSFDLPWPPARNPWNTDHHSGGSSSGSAAAVAVGYSPLALGTDTGGSIRIPAAFCGVVALKPTYGLVSRSGIIPNSYSLDTCGPLTWTVEDCAIALGAIAGHDPRSPGSLQTRATDYSRDLRGELKGLRVGVLRHFWEEDYPTTEAVANAMDEAIRVLQGLGAMTETVRIRPLQEYSDVKIVIAESELLSIHHQDLAERPTDFGQIFLGRVLGASMFQALDYVNAQRERRRMVDELAPLFDTCDVLVTVGPGPAPVLVNHDALVEKWQKPSLTAPFNVTGNPAMALCSGFTADGLPLSMQIIGPHLGESRVLQVGHAYEQATRWRAKRPMLDADESPHEIPKAAGTVPQSAQTDDARRLEAIAVQAGLDLPPHMLARFIETAPHAAAMARRLRRRRLRSEEPAAVFQRDDPRWQQV